MTTVKNPSRRRFLKNSAVAGGALVVGAHIPELFGPKLAQA